MLTLLIGIWQFSLVWAWGFFLERRLRFNLSYGYRAAIAFGLGESTLSLFFFVLGICGGLRLEVFLPLSILASCGLFSSFVTELNTLYEKIKPRLLQTPLATFISASIFLIYLLGACVPEREVDSVWYHLGVPLYYVTHGGAIQLVPFNMPSHYPMYLHLHYTFSLIFGNETTAKMFNVLHFVPLLILLWSVVRDRSDESWGMFAVAVYLTCLHFRLPVMANEQRSVFFFVFLSTVLIWLSFERKHWSLFLWGSYFCGVSMGTKFNGLIFGYVAQGLLMLVWFFIDRKDSLKTAIKHLLVHSFICWAVMSPWMIKSFIYTNNPLYPLLGEYFNTNPEFVPPMENNATRHGLNILKSKTITAFIAEINVNFQWFLYNADLIFFLGIMALLIVLSLRKKEWLLPAISGSIHYFLFTWMWGSDVGRLFAASYGVVVALIALAISWLSHRVSYGKWLVRFVLFSVFFTFFFQRYAYLKSPNIRWFGQIYCTEDSRRNWLSERNLFSADMFRMKDWMRDRVPKEDEIYVYRLGYPFYLYRKYLVSDALFGEQVDRWLLQGSQYTYRQLRSYHVRWMLINELPNQPIDPRIEDAWGKFKQTYLEKVYQEGSVALYKVHL